MLLPSCLRTGATPMNLLLLFPHTLPASTCSHLLSAFDHMLGFLKKINPEINGLTGAACPRYRVTYQALSSIASTQPTRHHPRYRSPSRPWTTWIGAPA